MMKISSVYSGAYWCSPDYQTMSWLTDEGSAGLPKEELLALGRKEASERGFSANGTICIGQRTYRPMTYAEAWCGMAAGSKGSAGEAWQDERG
jgi:hypothetical protein